MDISLQLLRHPAILFVDDTDFIITGQSNNEDSTSIILNSQHAMFFWSVLLYATGGSLRPDKCRWTLIDHKWTSGVPSYKKKHEVTGNLTAYNSDRQLEIIRRIEPDASVEILGVLLNTVGTDKKRV